MPFTHYIYSAGSFVNLILLCCMFVKIQICRYKIKKGRFLDLKYAVINTPEGAILVKGYKGNLH